jgi:hypothetical protein
VNEVKVTEGGVESMAKLVVEADTEELPAASEARTRTRTVELSMEGVLQE